MKQKLVIIGGTGDFGKWLSEFLKNNFGEHFEIFISGMNEQKSKESAEKIGVGYFKNNIEAVKNSQIIIFSVPINKTHEIIKEIGPFINAGSIVLDITSIKKVPSIALEQFVSKECLIIPTHPMFGPGLKSISGQIVVLTPNSRVLNNEKYQIFKKYLSDLGAKVIETTPSEHDQMMAVVQGLTHYSMFVIGKTIKEYGVNILKTLDFVSPIYKLMVASVSRYVSQSPELYADIQMNNDEILKIHDLFTTSSGEFNKMVKNKDREAFVKMVLDTRESFGKESCDFGKKYTDKIIYLIGRENLRLQENIGKNVKLENIYSKTLLEGNLKNIDDHNIYLNEEILSVNERVIL